MILDDEEEDLLEDFEEEDEDDDEKDVEGAWYDAKDVGCHCTDADGESSWEWDGGKSCYVCSGCGDLQ